MTPDMPFLDASTLKMLLAFYKEGGVLSVTTKMIKSLVNFSEIITKKQEKDSILKIHLYTYTTTNEIVEET
jgi:hypothetical protein